MFKALAAGLTWTTDYLSATLLDARNTCSSLGVGWRLPTIAEMTAHPVSLSWNPMRAYWSDDLDPVTSNPVILTVNGTSHTDKQLRESVATHDLYTRYQFRCVK